MIALGIATVICFGMFTVCAVVGVVLIVKSAADEIRCRQIMRGDGVMLRPSIDYMNARRGVNKRGQVQ